MQRHYDELAVYEREGYEIIVDKTWEDLGLDQCFDDSLDEDGKPYYDLKQMGQDIDSGKLEWFMLRVRVLVEGLELSSEYLGGMLYEDARECLKDGSAEDLIYTAMDAAKQQVYRLSRKFTELSNAVDAEGVNV
jgi:hypothetical protein